MDDSEALQAAKAAHADAIAKERAAQRRQPAVSTLAAMLKHIGDRNGFSEMINAAIKGARP